MRYETQHLTSPCWGSQTHPNLHRDTQGTFNLIDCTDIAALIPHSGRMVLLGRIIDYDEHTLSAELIIRSNGLRGDVKTVPTRAGI
ncbi:MAG: hypothetical protein CTY16_11380 [Methylobacter sp.]|nr:MAG: hypothetical protein CTY16_11380 [Methylobacter sp.]